MWSSRCVHFRFAQATATNTLLLPAHLESIAVDDFGVSHTSGQMPAQTFERLHTIDAAVHATSNFPQNREVAWLLSASPQLRRLTLRRLPSEPVAHLPFSTIAPHVVDLELRYSPRTFRDRSERCVASGWPFIRLPSVSLGSRMMLRS